MPLILGREHALGDVAAPAGLGARIVARPPLNRQRNQQHGDPGIGVRQIGKQGKLGHDSGVREQAIQSANLRQFEDPPRRPHRPDHGQNELNEIREDDRAQPAHHTVHQRDAAGDQQRQPARPTEQNAPEFDGGQADGGHDQDVEHQAEVQRPEAAKKRRRLAAVPQFIEADVGQDAGPTPQPRIDKHRHHACEQKRPPRPVACNPLLTHQVRHQVGGVCAERRGHHADAQKPPGHVSAREEVAGGIGFGLLAGPKANPQGQREIGPNENPIQGGQLHENKDTSSPGEGLALHARSSKQSEERQQVRHRNHPIPIEV